MKNVTEQTREELLESAKALELKVVKSITTETLRAKVELAAIERHETMAATVREKLRAKAVLKRRVAEVKAEAEMLGIAITIPAEATINDVVRLEKELGIKKKVPKPSPETVAIEKSKKVYAIFRNLEQEDLEILGVSLGGKYRFDFWPGKVHVLPEFLINHYRSRKNSAGTRPYSKLKDVGGSNEVAARMTAPQRRSRFTFEVLGDAPDNAEFGIVTDETILKKLEQFAA